MRYPIIGLHGRGGCGKSETAAIMCRYGFARRHIKYPMVRMLWELLSEAGVPDDKIARYLDGDLKREPIVELPGQPTGTWLQQSIGTDWGRKQIDEKLWAELWARWADSELRAGRRVVQESVRFENEAEFVRSRGGIVVEILSSRPGQLERTHESETTPIKCDLAIFNDGSLYDLEMELIRHELIVSS